MQISFCSTPEPVLPWEAAWLPACSSHSPFNSKGLLNYKQASCESLFPDRWRLLAAVMHCCMLPNMHMHVVLLESQECHLVNVRLRFFFFFSSLPICLCLAARSSCKVSRELSGVRFSPSFLASPAAPGCQLQLVRSCPSWGWGQLQRRRAERKYQAEWMGSLFVDDGISWRCASVRARPFAALRITFHWWTHAFCLNESCLLRTIQWAKQAKQPAGMAAALHQDFGLTNQPVLVSLWYFILAESKAPLTSVWVSRPATNLSAQFADKLPKEWLCHSCRKMFSSLKCNVAEYKPVFLV